MCALSSRMIETSSNKGNSLEKGHFLSEKNIHRHVIMISYVNYNSRYGIVIKHKVNYIRLFIGQNLSWLNDQWANVECTSKTSSRPTLHLKLMQL